MTRKWASRRAQTLAQRGVGSLRRAVTRALDHGRGCRTAPRHDAQCGRAGAPGRAARRRAAGPGAHEHAAVASPNHRPRLPTRAFRGACPFGQRILQRAATRPTSTTPSASRRDPPPRPAVAREPERTIPDSRLPLHAQRTCARSGAPPPAPDEPSDHRQANAPATGGAPPQHGGSQEHAHDHSPRQLPARNGTRPAKTPARSPQQST